MSTTVNLTGRLTAHPEMRFSANGKPVARFTVVTSRRVEDQQTGDWADADTSFWNCVTFGQLEAVAQLPNGVCQSDVRDISPTL